MASIARWQPKTPAIGGGLLAGSGCVFCLFGVLVLCCLVSCCFLFPSRVRSFELCANSMQS